MSFTDRLLARAAALQLPLEGVDVSRLQRYADLLLHWNARINLTSLPLAGWPDATLDRLFLEPIAAAPLVASARGTWIDLGSGGGSPAIPLAVTLEGMTLTMTESRGKKAAFLREAIRSLSLPGARVVGPFEELLADPPATVQLISCRAVSPSDILAVANHALADNGQLLFLGAEPLASLGRLTLIQSHRFHGSLASVLMAKPIQA